MLVLIPVILLSYLAGSFPTSIVVGKIFFNKDIRKFGSGNAGGTNTFRVFGWKAGVTVALFDVGKGVIAALFIARLGNNIPLPYTLVQLIAGSSAVTGHIWTVFAGFRGGKGVGTAVGMLSVLAPVPLCIAVLVFLLILLTTGIVSLGSIAGAVVFPAGLLVQYAITGTVHISLVIFSVILGSLIIFTHRSNIRRLIDGTENRFDNLMIFSKLFSSKKQ